MKPNVEYRASRTVFVDKRIEEITFGVCVAFAVIVGGCLVFSNSDAPARRRLLGDVSSAMHALHNSNLTTDQQRNLGVIAEALASNGPKKIKKHKTKKIKRCPHCDKVVNSKQYDGIDGEMRKIHDACTHDLKNCATGGGMRKDSDLYKNIQCVKTGCRCAASTAYVACPCRQILGCKRSSCKDACKIWQEDCAKCGMESTKCSCRVVKAALKAVFLPPAKLIMTATGAGIMYWAGGQIYNAPFPVNIDVGDLDPTGLIPGLPRINVIQEATGFDETEFTWVCAAVGVILGLCLYCCMMQCCGTVLRMLPIVGKLCFGGD